MSISMCAFLWLKSHGVEGAKSTLGDCQDRFSEWKNDCQFAQYNEIRNWSSYRHGHPTPWVHREKKCIEIQVQQQQVFQRSRSYHSACKVSNSAWHRICLGTFPRSLFLNVALEKDWIIAQNVIELDRIVTLTFNWQAGPTQHTHRISCKTLCWAFLQISLQLSSPRPVNYNSLLNPTIPELLEHVPRTLLCKTRVTLLYNI